MPLETLVNPVNMPSKVNTAPLQDKVSVEV